MRFCGILPSPNIFCGNLATSNFIDVLIVIPFSLVQNCCHITLVLLTFTCMSNQMVSCCGQPVENMQNS